MLYYITGTYVLTILYTVNTNSEVRGVLVELNATVEACTGAGMHKIALARTRELRTSILQSKH